MRARRLMVLVAVACASLGVAPARAAAPAGFVVAQGERLMLDGRPWRAVGVNVWDMDAARVVDAMQTRSGDVTGCYYLRQDLDAYLDETFRHVSQDLHATAVRTFGFRAMYTGGGVDWSSTDKLIHYAQKWNVRLIPVFGDQYGTCGSPPKDAGWYRSGYRTIVEQPWGIDYRSYVVRAVARYKDSPVIAFWQLMNEASAGPDTGALMDFSRDMVAAIRTDAGDPWHPINLGTTGGGREGNEAPAIAQLLDCNPSGGCNDLAEAHVFDATAPLPGLPMSSSVTAVVEAWTAGGTRRASSAVTLPIDGWAQLSFALPSVGEPFADWAISIAAPASGAFELYADDVLVQATPPQVYGFDGSTQGFTASGASLGVATSPVRTGTGALRATVPARTTGSGVTIDAPPLGGGASSIGLWLRANFRAPRPVEGASHAADLHAAVVSRGKPFVMGEAGWQADVPGVSGCTGRPSIADRATLLDAMMETQLDPVYGSSGLLIWDLKDPAQRVTTPSGALARDPNISCWSVTPGDPAEAIIREHADRVPAATPLPAPAPLPSYAPELRALAWPSGEVGYGSDVRFVLRATDGGSPVPNVRLVTGGGCFGEGRTNGLGLADFTCRITRTGSATITVTADPATCPACAFVLTFPVVVKRAVSITGVAGVVERGAPAPITLTIEDPLGASVAGVAWSVPECGASGVVGEAGAVAVVRTTCPTASTAWRRPVALWARVAAGETTVASSSAFVGLAFDRLYVDARAGDCVGITSVGSYAGFTTRPGLCRPGSNGTVAQWTHGSAVGTFQPSGGYMAVDADLHEGRRITGTFQVTGGRAFAAVLLRPAGAAVLAAS